MMHPFFEFFNSERPHVPENHADWPESWKKPSYKSYPRLPQIKLSRPELGNVSLKKCLLDRISSRDFTGQYITEAELSAFLAFGAGMMPAESNEEKRRMYPSAGALYALEIYLYILRTENVKKGIYHYNVLDHALEILSESVEDEVKKTFNLEFMNNASVICLFSMIPKRLTQKYGTFAFKVGLIEAGHIAENFYLISTALGLKSCVLAGPEEAEANAATGIDGVEETIFYSFAAGK